MVVLNITPFELMISSLVVPRHRRDNGSMQDPLVGRQIAGIGSL